MPLYIWCVVGLNWRSEDGVERTAMEWLQYSQSNEKNILLMV